MTKLHTKQQGSLGELVIMKDLMSKGYPCFVEYGDLSKVDLITLVDDKAIKIQVKCYTSVDGVVKLYTYKSGPNYHFTYSAQDFDVMAVYVIDQDKILYVGSRELLGNLRCFSIRCHQARNNQKSKTRLVEDFQCFEDALPK